MPRKDGDYTTREGHRGRLRKYFTDGREDYLRPIQQLEMLLFYAIPRKDVQPIARNLIARFVNLAGVFDAPIDQLKEVDGIGENAAILIKLIPTVMRGYSTARNEEAVYLNNNACAIAYITPFLAGKSVEEAHVMFLAGNCKLLCHEQMEKGIENRVNIYAKKICRRALALGARYVVLAHNHPSGIAVPSPEDDIATKQLMESLELLEIQLLDHIIICEGKSYSYVSEQQLAVLKKKRFPVNSVGFIADVGIDYTDMPEG